MSDYIKKYGQLTDIPKRHYTGYIWKSDQRCPKEVLDGTKEVIVTAEQNPFIVEALLFDEASNISVMVKHTGTYLIREFDLNTLPKETMVPKEYFSHRLEGVKKIKFKQIWLPENDKNCDGMEVLQLKTTVFTGFSK